MDPITIGLLMGGGAGLVNAWMAYEQQKKAQENERKSGAARASEARWSGFTGNAPSTEVQYDTSASPWMAGLSGGLQGFGSGMAIGQGMEKTALDKKLGEAQIGNYNAQKAFLERGGSPLQTGASYLPPRIDSYDLPDVSEDEAIIDMVMKKRGLR